MAKDFTLLERIFEKTDGCCHLCHKKLVFMNHGKRGSHGAWEKEHSVPQAKNGKDHLNNLFPACVECNNAKGVKSSRAVRRQNGKTRAPYSKAKKEKIKKENTFAGAVIGGSLGLLAGPVGVVAGVIVGGLIGKSTAPKK